MSRSRSFAALIFGLAALIALELLCRRGLLGTGGRGIIELTYELVGYRSGATPSVRLNSDVGIISIASWISVVSAAALGAIILGSNASKFSILRTALLGLFIPFASTLIPILFFSIGPLLVGNINNFEYSLMFLPIGLLYTQPLTSVLGVASAFLTRSVIQSTLTEREVSQPKRIFLILKGIILNWIGWFMLFPICFGAFAVLFIVILMKLFSDPSLALNGDRLGQEGLEVPQDQMLLECMYTPTFSFPSICVNDGERIFEAGKDPQWVLNVLRFKNLAFDSRYNVLPYNYRETDEKIPPSLGLPPAGDEESVVVYLKRLARAFISKD